MVNSDKYKDSHFTLEDSCAHGYLPINVEIDATKITRLDPDTVWVQRGGGFAVDNLFWSEEHMNEWLDEHPEYRELNQQAIGEFLDDLKVGRERTESVPGRVVISAEIGQNRSQSDQILLTS